MLLTGLKMQDYPNKYTIKPLMLSKVVAEKGPMTYLAYSNHSIVRPYVMWYIQVGKKNVLVDSAIEAEDFKNYHPAFNNIHYEPVQKFEDALAKINCTPNEIDVIIQTHLHVDHIYNTPKCKNAIIYVQQKELEFALDPHPIFEILYPKEIIKKLNFEVIKGDQVIFPGLTVMFTPGHTPGGQSVVVETEKGKAVISGICSIMENFNPPQDVKTKVSPLASYPVIAPGIHTDLFQAYDNLVRIKNTADIIIPSHEPNIASLKQIP